MWHRHRQALLVAGALAATVAYLVALMHERVRLPYMDEPFHVRQVCRYLRFDATWDPLLTTLPGLYLASMPYVWLVQWASGVAGECPLTLLRTFNAVLLVASFVLAYLLAIELQPHASRQRGVTKALMLVSLPLFFFYGLVYYTDVGGAFAVLLMLYLAYRDRLLSSALTAAVAVLFRQTNVIWVAFCVAVHVRHEQLARDPTQRLASPSKQLSSFVGYVARHMVAILRRYYGFVLVLLAFVAFVVLNGGIVVGARDAHQASFHAPQLGYFVAFCLAFASAVTLERAMHLVRRRGEVKRRLLSWRTWVLAAMAVGIALWLIDRFTIEHPYLLSDNRHYVFYLWKNLYRRFDWFRYAMAPIYVAGAWLLWHHEFVTRADDVVCKLLFIGATSLVLVPSPLIEFRYFVIPFLLLYAHVKSSATSEWLVIAQNLTLNAIVLYAFLYRPFAGVDGESRFMW